MKAEQFIVDEVTKYLKECARKNKYQVVDAVQEMPTFEGFILPYYVSTMEGTKYPFDIENMYIYCDRWEEFYNETVINVAQEILEAEQIKEA